VLSVRRGSAQVHLLSMPAYSRARRPDPLELLPTGRSLPTRIVSLLALLLRMARAVSRSLGTRRLGDLPETKRGGGLAPSSSRPSKLGDPLLFGRGWNEADGVRHVSRLAGGSDFPVTIMHDQDRSTLNGRRLPLIRGRPQYRATNTLSWR